MNKWQPVVTPPVRGSGITYGQANSNEFFGSATELLKAITANLDKLDYLTTKRLL